MLHTKFQDYRTEEDFLNTESQTFEISTDPNSFAYFNKISMA